MVSVSKVINSQPTTVETLIYVYISSRLDYCHTLFFGVYAKSIYKISYSIYKALLLECSGRTRLSDHITLILQQLHRLPV